jgi:hypothetical protein
MKNRFLILISIDNPSVAGLIALQQPRHSKTTFGAYSGENCHL